MDLPLCQNKTSTNNFSYSSKPIPPNLFAHLTQAWYNLHFRSNDKLSFSSFLCPLLIEDPRDNTFIDQKFNQIHAEIMEYFTERGVE